jgi:hypothetical protein
MEKVVITYGKGFDVLNLYIICLFSMFQKAMLASAKLRAHEAFKNGNYLDAAQVYTKVYY